MMKAKKQILLSLLSLSLSCLIVVVLVHAKSPHHHHHDHQHQHQHHHRHHSNHRDYVLETESLTKFTTLDNNNNNKTENDNDSDNTIVSNHRIKIPGLYDERENPWIIPLQGQINFERSIYNDTSKGYEKTNKTNQQEQEQTISLIQYYMATCPDCQGFSPYFKRFVSDIGPHWRHLVRVYTINCNDEININLCWQQNPNLIVPLVRWYTFSQILLDSHQRHHHQHHHHQQQQQQQQQQVTGKRIFKDYPIDLLNVAHRSYIKKQRRDLISLRHATLRYIESIVDHLSTTSNNETNEKDDDLSSEFYSKLPIRFKLLKPIGKKDKGSLIGDESNDADERVKFFNAISRRSEECSKSIQQADEKNNNITIENFIIFEKIGSYVGKTFVADWSNWTCEQQHDGKQASARIFMFHYSDNLNLLDNLNIVDDRANNQGEYISMNKIDAKNRQPLLLSFETNISSSLISHDKLEFHLLASNQTNSTLDSVTETTSLNRSRRHTVGIKTADQQQQDASYLSIEKYYRKFRDPMAKSSQKLSSKQRQMNISKKRLRRSTTNETIANKIDYHEAENINWGPEHIYPGEESIRYQFNQIVAHKINKTIPINLNDIPGAHLGGENPGEIPRNKPNSSALIPPKEDDLTLLKLTDYYKVLDEIIHKNILSRAEIDGYQLLSSTCFIRHLSRQFPFQGQQNGQQRSVARHYLELLYQRFSELMTRKGSKSFHGCSGNLLKDQRDELERVKVNTKELQEIQIETRKEFDVGLPSEKHFKWQYCAGSSEYLRGHTCSLWVLFHTLTVHEYLNYRDHRKIIIQDDNNNNNNNNNCTMLNSTLDEDLGQQYKFMIKYSKNKEKCDPGNPEPALIGAKSWELFEEPLHFILSNIVNFVRYYLSCTNCAAHFNCMVKNSPGLNLCNPKPDDHVLWLWEAHNRVNVRTKSTHSEDPNRPKHVFPVYEACPECYLEQPTNETSFEQMKFNRRALVDFIVARYRKSAILNNKIKIEDLFRKPIQRKLAAGGAAAGVNNSSSTETAAGRGGELLSQTSSWSPTRLTSRLTSLVM